MDDIIDLEIDKIDGILNKIDNDPENLEVKRVERNLWHNIKTKAQEGRRTGVGITAEGDMLAALGLKYGSDNAIDFSVEVHKVLALAAYRSSVDMAKERGEFTIYDAQREKTNPFIQRLGKVDTELIKDMERYGRRNISLLTIAPTGTTSMMTQTSSGIEPVFLPVYRRRRKVNPNDSEVNVNELIKDEVGDYWEEYNVFHHKFLVWLDANGYDSSKIENYSLDEINALVEKSPYFGATSNDVNWVSKVKMQGKIQKWVDHSISVTVNLPNNVPEDIVGKVYQTAWESGCKGVTVYRDGSRSGVLISTEKKEKEPTNEIKKRPKVLEADVVRFNNNNGKWIAFVGLLEGRPYEIFTGKVDDEVLLFPKSIERGRIIKIRDNKGKSRYDFQYIDKHGYENTLGGLSRLFDKEFWNYAKLISGVLRYNMPITNVLNLVSSLQLDNDSINSWKAGVERALKKYVEDGTKAKTGTVCPECGEVDTMEYKEGCLSCNSCGYSKCG